MAGCLYLGTPDGTCSSPLGTLRKDLQYVNLISELRAKSNGQRYSIRTAGLGGAGCNVLVIFGFEAGVNLRASVDPLPGGRTPFSPPPTNLLEYPKKGFTKFPFLTD